MQFDILECDSDGLRIVIIDSKLRKFAKLIEIINREAIDYDNHIDCHRIVYSTIHQIRSIDTGIPLDYYSITV